MLNDHQVYANGAKGKGAAASGKGAPAGKPAPPKVVDEVQLAGLNQAHVDQFVNMGFEKKTVIDTLARLNYRGANIANISDDNVLNALLG